MTSNRTPDDQAPDDQVIERRLLELAYTTDTKITAPSLAYFARCTIEGAARVLDDLAAHERVHMDVEDDGTIVYRVPGRQRLAAPAPPMAPLQPALVRRAPPSTSRAVAPLIAAALTLCVPGAGHLYAGRVLAAFLWFFVVSAGYALILPGLILHVISVASAANAAHRRAAQYALAA
jgi:TM2 domain-containing membrane protein YozV